jgi:hypothetical protein
MAILVNQSGLPAECVAVLDQDARQFALVVLVATFEARPGQPLRLAKVPSPVRSVDEYYGDVETSSLAFDSDLAMEKPRVDILVKGRAFAPSARKVERVRVSVRVGGWRKELQVTGNRLWKQGLLGPVPSAPEPFETMPVVYERAYGGKDNRNPVGLSARAAATVNPALGTALPNIEYPSQQMTSARSVADPAGFGPLARNWQPRLGFAGTYDAAWLAEQWPLLPQDFDPRFFQAAPLDQQLDAVHGGEPVEVENMTPEGLWRFTLPRLDVPIRLAYPQWGESTSLRVDTVFLEPDDCRVRLTARAKIPIPRGRPPLRAIVLGHVTTGWWRAFVYDKVYMDWARQDGRIAHETVFQS